VTAIATASFTSWIGQTESSSRETICAETELGKWHDKNGRPISAGLTPTKRRAGLPAAGGATNWYSPSYNLLSYFYFRSWTLCTHQVEHRTFEEDTPTIHWYTGVGEPGKGFINAFDSTLWILPGRSSVRHGQRLGSVMSTATGLIATDDTRICHPRWTVRKAAVALQRWATDPCVAHELPVDGKEFFAIAAGTMCFRLHCLSVEDPRWKSRPPVAHTIHGRISSPGPNKPTLLPSNSERDLRCAALQSAAIASAMHSPLCLFAYSTFWSNLCQLLPAQT